MKLGIFKYINRSFHHETKEEDMENLVGSIYVLYVLPVWATAAILYATLALTILVGRNVFEGIPYQVSYSAMIGDIGLITCVLIAATILQRGGAYIPQLLQSGTCQIATLLLCVALGLIACMLTLGSRSGQVMDIYHDVVVAPLFLYLAITLAPAIYTNGTKVEITAVICFVLLWLALVGFDIKYGRLHQYLWLKSHGVTLKN